MCGKDPVAICLPAFTWICAPWQDGRRGGLLNFHEFLSHLSPSAFPGIASLGLLGYGGCPNLRGALGPQINCRLLLELV